MVIGSKIRDPQERTGPGASHPALDRGCG